MILLWLKKYDRDKKGDKGERTVLIKKKKSAYKLVFSMSKNNASWKHTKAILSVTEIQVLVIFFLKIHSICAVVYSTQYPRTPLRKGRNKTYYLG